METKSIAANLRVVTLPANDLAYSNSVYVHPDCSLFPATHVRIGQRCVFALAVDSRIEPGCIGLSTLQRDGFGGAIKNGDTISVHSFNPQDAPKAIGVSIVYEPVANFKVQVALHLLQKFLAKQFDGQIVSAGQFLASNQFEKRVFKFEVKQVKTLDSHVSVGRITPETIFTCECHPKARDVVEQVPPSPRPLTPETKDQLVSVAELEALITAYHRVEWTMKPGGVDKEKTRPYDQVLDILGSRIEAIWEQEVGDRKRARIEYVPGTVECVPRT